jgi:hypothetical protein
LGLRKAGPYSEPISGTIKIRNPINAANSLSWPTIAPLTQY